ncbi:MAG: CDGSH iron-sulfur domain-containing protein [Flavobacteriaceae bacterium]|nr:CDGSH iron-sulfur domain-containing protein [Flavobacteriaceae bacterium]
MELPKRAGDSPVKVELEKDRRYAWCTCGLSDKQPLCDGAHKGTDMRPQVFTAADSKDYNLCNCKQTKNAPYCDGSHKR